MERVVDKRHVAPAIDLLITHPVAMSRCSWSSFAWAPLRFLMDVTGRLSSTAEVQRRRVSSPRCSNNFRRPRAQASQPGADSTQSCLAIRRVHCSSEAATVSHPAQTRPCGKSPNSLNGVANRSRAHHAKSSAHKSVLSNSRAFHGPRSGSRVPLVLKMAGCALLGPADRSRMGCDNRALYLRHGPLAGEALNEPHKNKRPRASPPTP